MFPAPAGINRKFCVSTITSVSVPRASGDKPILDHAFTEVMVCSPRQRG
ncbi:hypothetical protein EC2726800_3526 [Escherichia coli 2726800]|nr:hypothetical protein ECDEC14A_3002 [Escherichia coli DEC14A]EMX74863.1 hypothetical protein EC2726800_3526 [Escherichia coli 2726800]END39647.1 hypothetical protein EC2854350_3096 [Escherichia coli 2854350]